MVDLPPIEIYRNFDDASPIHTLTSYVSFIWNNRLNEASDFELVISASDMEAANHLRIDRFVRFGTIFGGVSATIRPRQMIIHTKQYSLNADYGAVYTIKGWCLTYALLQFRPTQWKQFEQNSVYRAAASSAMFMAINRRLTGVSGGIGGEYRPEDRVPINTRTIGTTPSGVVTLVDSIKPLYETLQGIAKEKGVGFSVDRDTTASSGLRFTYIGRSIRDSSLESPVGNRIQPVVFSTGLDNIESIDILDSVEGSVNGVAAFREGQVWGVFGERSIHTFSRTRGTLPDNVFARRTKAINVRSRNINQDETVTQYNEYVLGVIRQELSENSETYSAEIVVKPNSYQFPRDYELGNIVTAVDNRGSHKSMQVVGHMYSVDKSGITEFPTLAIPEDMA